MELNVWKISNRQSSIQFKVRYLRIGHITGAFLRFSGTVAADEAFAAPNLALSVEAGSVDTYNEERNAKLRSEVFFDAERYPRISFNSEGGWSGNDGGIPELSGYLVIRETRKPFIFIVSFSGLKEGQKRSKARLHLSGRFSLSALGLSCDEQIGDEVQLNAEISLIREN